MIVCRECGEQQGDEAVFCGRCGVFLEWEGERVVPEGGAEGDAEATQQRTDEGAGSAAEVTAAASSVDGVAGADGTGQVPAGETAPGGAVPQPSGNETVRQGEQAAAPPASQPPAAQPPAQPPRRKPAARQPAEVRRTRKPAPRRVRQQLPTGSLVCGDCGAGNDPGRRFCHSCGHSLADAEVVGRPPWWRRMFSRERTYAAGTRRRPRRPLRTVVRIGVVAVVIAAILALVGPLRSRIFDAYHSVQDMMLPPRHVHPSKVLANGSVRKHKARLAFDGASNTYWESPAVNRKRAVPWLRAQFAQPVDLVAIGLTGGTSTQTPKYLAGPRPARLEIAVTTKSGVKTKKVTLDDSAGFQQVDFSVQDVRRVRINVVASKGATHKAATAVTEVEFFARH